MCDHRKEAGINGVGRGRGLVTGSVGQRRWWRRGRSGRRRRLSCRWPALRMLSICQAERWRNRPPATSRPHGSCCPWPNGCVPHCWRIPAVATPWDHPVNSRSPVLTQACTRPSGTLALDVAPCNPRVPLTQSVRRPGPPLILGWPNQAGDSKPSHQRMSTAYCGRCEVAAKLGVMRGLRTNADAAPIVSRSAKFGRASQSGGFRRK